MCRYSNQGDEANAHERVLELLSFFHDRLQAQVRTVLCRGNPDVFLQCLDQQHTAYGIVLDSSAPHAHACVRVCARACVCVSDRRRKSLDPATLLEIPWLFDKSQPASHSIRATKLSNLVDQPFHAHAGHNNLSVSIYQDGLESVMEGLAVADIMWTWRAECCGPILGARCLSGIFSGAVLGGLVSDRNADFAKTG
jgi:hypothetical protein